MTLRTMNPGDLITSADWNDLVAALTALQGQVSQLASGGPSAPPYIVQVLPTGPVTAGDTIRIFGSNFQYTQGGQSVYFGSTRATTFGDKSSDTLLIVQVPDPVEGATEAGTAMTMTVANLHSYTTWALTVKAKPVPLGGGFEFSYHGSRPTATPTAGQPIFYDFILHSFASENLVVTIAPVFASLTLPPGVADPGVASMLAVLDSDGSERADHTIPLPEGTSKTISVRFNIPAGLTGMRFVLRVTASAPELTPVVETLPEQEVGQESEQPEPTIETFEFAAIADGQGSFSSDTGGLDVDGTLSIRGGTQAVIEMRTVFKDIPAGATYQYQLSAAVDAPANDWSAAVDATMQNPLPVASPGGLVSIYFDITAPSAAATAVVRLALTRMGPTKNNKRAVAYRLQLLP